MSSLELRHYLVSITARLSAGLKNNANIFDHSAQTDRYYAASKEGVALPQNCQRKVSLTRIIASAHKPTLEFAYSVSYNRTPSGAFSTPNTLLTVSMCSFFSTNTYFVA